MRQAITSQQDFDQKVKNSSGGILLLFHSDASSDQDLQNTKIKPKINAIRISGFTR